MGGDLESEGWIGVVDWDGLGCTFEDGHEWGEFSFMDSCEACAEEGVFPDGEGEEVGETYGEGQEVGKVAEVFYEDDFAAGGA